MYLMRLSSFSISSIAATSAAARSGGEAFTSQILFVARGPLRQSGPIAITVDAMERAKNTGARVGCIVVIWARQQCSTNTSQQRYPAFYAFLRCYINTLLRCSADSPIQRLPRWHKSTSQVLGSASPTRNEAFSHRLTN